MASEQIEKWNQRYREGHDDLPVPLPFFIDLLSGVPPGRALDLACGTGRHSKWLAERGWQVVAVDGAEAAITELRAAAPDIDSHVVDLEAEGYRIEGGAYDLIVDTFFLHRPLFSQIREALRPGGLVVFAFHRDGRFGISTEELLIHFPAWRVIHQVEHSQPPTIELALRIP